MIGVTPSPIAFAIGPLAVHWYGIAYAVGLAAAYLVISRGARWRGLEVAVLANAMIVVAAAALVGGRLYGAASAFGRPPADGTWRSTRHR